jgi:hypothetical protein
MGKKTVKKIVKDRYPSNAFTTVTSTNGAFPSLPLIVEDIIGAIIVKNGKLILRAEGVEIPLDDVEEIKKIVVKTMLRQQAEEGDRGRFSNMTFNPGPGVIINWADPNGKTI